MYEVWTGCPKLEHGTLRYMPNICTLVCELKYIRYSVRIQKVWFTGRKVFSKSPHRPPFLCAYYTQSKGIGFQMV